MTKKNKKNRRPNPDAQKVQEMIKETLFPEVYSMWLDNKITLLSALNLCLNIKLDYALQQIMPGDDEPENPEDSDEMKDTDSQDDQ